MDPRKDFIDSYSQGFHRLFVPYLERGAVDWAMDQYFDEDHFSGYPTEPGGSVWESEGKALYAMVRALKPKNILEIGNFQGCSANHILQAVEENGILDNGRYGRVTLLDIADQLVYDRMHNNQFIRIIEDSVKYLSCGLLRYDMYCIDGDHSYEHTKKELEMIIKYTEVPCWIWAHDVFVTHDASCQVRKTWDEMAHHFVKMETFQDSVSNCGFVIAKYEPK